MLGQKRPLFARERHLRRVEYEHLVELGAFRDERVELLYGHLVEMSPVERAHAYALMQLQELFPLALARRARVRSQLPFVAQDESLPEPDVAIVPLGDYVDAHPSEAHLLIEVSDSSLAYDRFTKGPLYAASGVPEYWIVNLVDDVVEVYTSPNGERYAIEARRKRGESLVVSAFPDIVIAVDVLLPVSST